MPDVRAGRHPGPAVNEQTGVATRVGPASATLPAAIREAIVAHARAEAPNEMCGLIVGTALPADAGVALRWEPALNAAASPRRFDMADPDLIRLTLEIDGRGEAVWAVAHSHPRSAAVPSAADVRGALLGLLVWSAIGFALAVRLFRFES